MAAPSLPSYSEPLFPLPRTALPSRSEEPGMWQDSHTDDWSHHLSQSTSSPDENLLQTEADTGCSARGVRATTSSRDLQSALVQQQHSLPRSTETFSFQGPTAAAANDHHDFDYIQDWNWEVLSAFVSLSCTIAIIIILFLYREQPQSSWPFVIPPNTFVATLSTFSRAALMVPVASCISQLAWINFTDGPHPLHRFQLFDDASRGPRGAVALLWETTLHAKLAAWGCIITVLTLAMGPFTQLVLSSPSRSIATFNATATLGTAQSYEEEINNFEGLPGPGQRMRSAVRSGLYDLEYQPRYHCPSDNCFWPNITTLAICSHCSDVSLMSTAVCQNGHCNYTTPSGLEVEVTPDLKVIVGSGKISPPDTYAVSFDDDDLHQNNALCRFAVASWIHMDIQSPPNVTECTMDLCATAFANASISNGKFIPGHIQKSSLHTNSTLPKADPETGKPIPGSHLLKFETPYNPSSRFRNSTYTVNGLNYWSLRHYLLSIFGMYGDDIDFAVAASQLGVVEAVRLMADSMTYAIGRNPNATESPGYVVTSERVIAVQWWWLMLPVAEVLMGIGLLIATIIHTNHRGVTSWKSSSIMPFFIQPKGWDDEEIRAGESAKDLEKRSKNMRGRLVKGPENTLFFVNAGSKPVSRWPSALGFGRLCAWLPWNKN